MSDDNGDALLNIMGEVGPLIAMWTGVKAQFVEAGWEPRNAELMVIELWRTNNKPAATP